MVVIVAANLLVRTRLEGAARAAGVETHAHAQLPDPPDEPPAAVVLDVGSAADLGGIGAWRARWPELRILAVIAHVDEEARRAAEAAGCEIVTHGDVALRGPALFGAPGA